jgi:hypothetical protein
LLFVPPAIAVTAIVFVAPAAAAAAAAAAALLLPLSSLPSLLPLLLLSPLTLLLPSPPPPLPTFAAPVIGWLLCCMLMGLPEVYQWAPLEHHDHNIHVDAPIITPTHKTLHQHVGNVAC